MNGWKERKAWLEALEQALPETLESPLETARFELGAYFQGSDFTAEVKADRPEEEEYEIIRDGNRYLLHGGKTGVLYGAYRLIRCLKAGLLTPAGPQTPYYPLRMLNCWDNMSGEVERGYAGRSIWFEGGAFQYEDGRIRQLGRMLASVGINVLCVNNVNVHQPAQHLLDDMLPQVSRFARLLRPFGVRLMLSIDFSQPMQDGLPTADPLDEGVQIWWSQKARAVWEAVPDLAGFLVKADSEHRPGPNTYNRTHAEGANMLARAIRPFGGKLIWRAFVYNCMQDWRDTKTDRPRAAYDLYAPMDGQFDDNVIVQIKHGPYDFQVREPISPLLYAMEKTHTALEIQLAQEYTGHQIDLYAMPPLMREVFDQMGKERVQAVAAVSNLGRDDNWTGHPFAALNLFSYGEFSWNPDADSRDVTAEWARLTYDALSEEETDSLVSWLLRSREIYEKYTAPLGLCWMVQPNIHYGPSPYGYEFQAWGTYNRADRDAVGIDRTEQGTGYVNQYPPEWKSLFEDSAACPDHLLLFFHRLPYGFIMKDGRTLIQRIYDDHFEGYEEAERMADAVKALPLPEKDMRQIAERMEMQLANAREWRDVTNTFFHRLSGVQDQRGRKIYD